MSDDTPEKDESEPTLLAAATIPPLVLPQPARPSATFNPAAAQAAPAAPAAPAAAAPERVNLFGVTEALGKVRLDTSKASVMVPSAAVHIDNAGRHAPGYNETDNRGFGFSAPLKIGDSGTSASAFVVGYRSSYANTEKFKDDYAIVAGVNLTPLRAAIGPMDVKAGVTAAVAYTTQGRNAAAAPALSQGKFTLMGSLHAEVTHRQSGVGVGIDVVPPAGKNTVGVVAAYMKVRF